MKKLLILTTEMILGIGSMTSCAVSEKSTENRPSVNSQQHQTTAENKASGEIKAAVNKANKAMQTESIRVFDGRDGKVANAKLSEVDLALVEADVRKKAQEDFLKKQIIGADFNWQDEFKILDVAEGSFSASHLDGQRAVLYRFSYTNGVVILSDGDIVAHYSGGPGDYAFYTAIKSLPDVNQNGLSELILFRNVEDNEDIIPYLFEAQGGKIKFLGEGKYFGSDYMAGDDTDSTKAKQIAFAITVRPSKKPVFLQETYERTGSKGTWKLTKKAEKFSWENRTGDGIYDLTKIG